MHYFPAIPGLFPSLCAGFVLPWISSGLVPAQGAVRRESFPLGNAQAAGRGGLLILPPQNKQVLNISELQVYGTNTIRMISYSFSS